MRTSKTITRIAPVVAAILVFLFASALPCLAAEAEGGAGHTDNPLSVNLTVAIATIVVFVLLVLILSKTAWGPILKGLKAREDGIRTSIEGAERANADAKALLADYQRKLDTAADEARSILEEGRKDAEELRARIEAEGAAETAKQRERAVRDIDLAKDAAIKELHERVAILATDVAGRILQAKLDPAQHRRLVEEAVASYEHSRKAPGARA